MDLSIEREQAQSLIRGMDIPVFKTDLAKAQNVTWLLQNLRTRNVRHKDYVLVMRLFIKLAEAANNLKRSERQALVDHLIAVEAKCFGDTPPTGQPGGRALPEGDLKVRVPAKVPGTNERGLYPHQEEVLRSLQKQASGILTLSIPPRAGR